MKLFLEFFILAVTAVCMITAGRPDFVTDEILEMVASDKARCMKEHGTTESMIDAVNEGNMVNDRAITCYMYCLFEAFSLVDEDGTLEVEMLVGFLPENIQASAETVISFCSEQSADDVCDKMYDTAKCIADKRPDLWFMV
uniref:OBP5 n=1 Tax=Trichogramma japonicum TaxID=311206 RepID=A0A2K5B191_9HYME|nr:OBP5 [Trichogramma japonicum]